MGKLLVVCILAFFGHLPQTGAVDYRLPSNSRPLHYVIKLDPHLSDQTFTFSGEVTITLEVLQLTSTITLHSKDQTFDTSATSLVYVGQNDSYVVSHSYDTERDFLVLSTVTVLPIGNYTLKLAYTGNLRDDMIGFYKSSYTNDDNETVWIATSKFEPTYARYAFPCYDEPALKATVEIWLKREENQHSLANTNSLSETNDSSDGKIWTQFETTPLISTYLIAFMVSDFANISNANGTFGVWARSSAIDTAQYAFEFGETALEALENYTGIKYYDYALPKMDQIAIPDFASGAMENWGLVTYRERYLLYKDGVSTTSDKQNIATVISHEFAHQWFGNLVGPFWWTYLWLNEGFATYFEYFTTAEIEPDWRLDEQFVVADLQASAFAADGLTSSHPLNADVESPTEIKAIFDSISYAKGGSVIRMLEHIVGTDIFKRGLTAYLSANEFSNATSDYLWTSFQTIVDAEGIDLDVKERMDTWVTQAGYPVINVARDYESNTADLSQERFYLKNKTADGTSYSWWVPINWVIASNPNFTDTTATVWMNTTDSANISITDTVTGLAATESDWILLNKQQTGFYRVNYDEANWNLLISYLNSSNYTNVHVVNRAQLVDDAMNLARAGYLNYSIALNLSTYLAQETDYIPWYSAFTAFSYIRRVLANTESYDLFKEYVLKLTSKVTETMGYEEEADGEHVHIFLRTNALNWACNLEDSNCLTFASTKLSAWLVDGDESAIIPNLKTVVYCAGIRQSDKVSWDLMWNKYLATDLSSEQTRILTGLGCTEDKDILTEYMKLATTSGSGIRSQDSTNAFSSVYTSSSKNVDVALDYVINNLEDMYNYYGSITSITTLLSGIGLRINTAEQLEKLKAFAEDQAAILGTAAATAISNAEQNIAWLESYEPAIREWLQSKIDLSDTTDYPETEDPSEATTVLPEETSPGAAGTMFSSALLTIALVYLVQHFN